MPELPLTKRKYVRISPSQWAEIEGLWQIGDVTLQELEIRYGVSRRALQSHFAKRGTVKGEQSAQLVAAVKQQVFGANQADPELTTSRAVETRETAYANAKQVEALIMAQLALAQQDPSQAIRSAGAIKALTLAAAGLERLHALKWRALGLDKDSLQGEELPVLVFEDLTATEIKAIQEREPDEDFGDAAPCSVSEDEEEVLLIENEQFVEDEESDDDAEIREMGGRLVKCA